MSFIYLSEHCTLKSYSATTKGGISVIKIEVKTTDPYELAAVLRELAKAEAEQKEARKPRKAATEKKAAPMLALAAPLKQLPYYGDEDE